MRFLLDMGVSPRIASVLREDGHDVVHLLDEHLERLSDRSIFEKAVAERRIVVTFDLDFGEIAVHTGSASASVILFRVRNTRIANVQERLSAVLAAVPDSLAEGAIVVVEDHRLRVRSLPSGA